MMKEKLSSVLKRILIAAAMVCTLSSLTLTSFWMGRLAGALNPARNMEKPMCVVRAVALRESPTGYVIGDVPAGSMVWFMKLDLPFAYVTYFDGSAWLSGSVTASALDICE